MILHFLRGANCAAHVLLTGENSGLFAANSVIGFAKVIGGPCLAVLSRVSVARLTPPTLTMPKSFGDGLIFSRAAT